MHLGCGNSYYQYKLGDERIENNPAEKGLEVLVGGKLVKRQQCALAAQKASCSPALGDIQRQFGLGSEQPDLAVDVSVCCRGVTLDEI